MAAFSMNRESVPLLTLQAKSKQKILDKMEADGFTKPVSRERTFAFAFPSCEKVSFGTYTADLGPQGSGE